MNELSKSKGKVILVDDEEDLVKFFKWQLEKIGYEVYFAFSGNEALRIMEKKRFEVLIVDIRMPEMDGIELMKHSIDLNSDLQCIVITGHGDIDSSIEAMKIGAINYLRKPIKLAELDIAIEQGLDRLRLILEVRNKQEQLEKANIELQELRDKLAKELEETKEALKVSELRESVVKLMKFALRCWEQSTQKTKIDLAEESGIWNVNLDNTTGSFSVRAMDRYLSIERLPPSRPRWRDVLRTGFFVLENCKLSSKMETKLEKLIDKLEAVSN